MKRLNILQFFSKKGVLAIGLIAGMVLSLFCCQSVPVSASELGNDPDSIHKPGENNQFPAVSGSVFRFTSWWVAIGQTAERVQDFSYDFVQKSNAESVPLLSNTCYYYTTEYENRNGLGTMYRINIEVTSSFAGNHTIEWTGQYRDGSAMSTKSSSFNDNHIDFLSGIKDLPIYLFESKDMSQKYLRGEISANSALNYDAIQKRLEAVSGYDDSLPYFDKAVMELNNNDSVTYTSAMSADMQEQYYNMNIKVIDKDNSEAGETGEHYRSYVEMYAVAIYASNKDLGVFNNALLKTTGGIANQSKIDDLVKFGSNGKIIVSGMGSRNSSLVSAFLNGSMGADIVTLGSTSSLYAVPVDCIQLSDKVTSFPKVVRNLSASSTIDDSSILQAIVWGSVGTDAYTLIGYAADVRVVYYEVSTGKYIASRDTYTYTWVYHALQDKYGSGTIAYDGAGNITDMNSFDNTNVDTGSNWGSVPEYSEASLEQYVKNGFGLLGKNGFFVLTRQVFSFLPLELWILIYFALAVSISIMVLKVVRGM